MNFDPNPTVDSLDPLAHVRYAERLDRELPGWWQADAAGMHPALAEQVAIRRAVRRVRPCPRCGEHVDRVQVGPGVRMPACAYPCGCWPIPRNSPERPVGDSGVFSDHAGNGVRPPATRTAGYTGQRGGTAGQ